MSRRYVGDPDDIFTAFRGLYLWICRDRTERVPSGHIVRYLVPGTIRNFLVVRIRYSDISRHPGKNDETIYYDKRLNV
jgi:hypothetical protein